MEGEGGNLHPIFFIVRKFCTLRWSKMPKFGPLSDFIIFTWPLLEMKRRSEMVNDSVGKYPATSTYIALVVKQV